MKISMLKFLNRERLVPLALALGVASLFSGCKPEPSRPSTEDEWAPVVARPAPGPAPGPAPASMSEADAMIREGEALARAVCATCHLYPEPEVLDRVTWGLKALPKMGEMMGIRTGVEELAGLSERVREKGVFPTAPIIAIEQWRAICSFYLATAPVAALPQGARPEIGTELDRFELLKPNRRLNGRAVMVKIDEQSSRIFLGEFDTNTLTIMSGTGIVQAITSFDSPPVSLEVGEGRLTVTLMGSYDPSDELEGSVVGMGDVGSGGSGVETILKNLPRTTHTRRLDVNSDGKMDFVVCGYGNYLGSLSWHENMGDGVYEERVIHEQSGAIRSEVFDLNGDGFMDLVAVFAQAHEGIFAHYNDGKGGFTTEPLIRAHPAWGFSGFELVDFNGDGFMDILATNGDNGDFGVIVPPFKNYHGVRLYLNDGHNKFAEAWFFPLNGAYRALARDFDQDGDLDIAAISYFPDYRRSPRESFVYLENISKKPGVEFDFKPSSFYESIAARWCVMDVGDVDGDGDQDIVLGANNHGPTYVPSALQDKWTEVGNTVFILRNRTK